MRWKTNKAPNVGERKHSKYFAVFPTDLSDGYTVWLEQYWAEEEWVEIPYDDTASGWRTIRTHIKAFR